MYYVHKRSTSSVAITAQSPGRVSSMRYKWVNELTDISTHNRQMFRQSCVKYYNTHGRGCQLKPLTTEQRSLGGKSESGRALLNYVSRQTVEQRHGPVPESPLVCLEAWEWEWNEWSCRVDLARVSQLYLNKAANASGSP